MKQSEKAPANSESGKGVAKSSVTGLPDTTPSTTEQKKSASKFSPCFWSERVFRPAYSASDGEQRQVAEWYVRIQHAGRREALGLGTNNQQEAARRAARVYQLVRAKGWEAALREFAPDRALKTGCPRVGEFLLEVEKKAFLNPRTLRGYTVSLRWLVARAFGIKATEDRFNYRGDGNRKWRERIDRVSLEKLTPERVESALTSFIAAAGQNPVAQQKAKRNASSIARQARALFSPKLLRKLSFEPFKSPFAGLQIESARPVRYVGTVNAASLIRDGRAELAEKDGQAYVALLLALGSGLRKREIDNLTWPQVDAERNVIRVLTTETFVAKTNDSEGEVYVDPGLIAELEHFRGSSTGLFVLESELKPKPESKVAYYRAAATFDRLTQWLRGKGVLTHKPIHTLRKEFGALINESSDIYTASRQLRHSSIATTSAYYVDNRKRVAPAIAAMLAPEKKAEGKGEKH